MRSVPCSGTTNWTSDQSVAIHLIKDRSSYSFGLPLEKGDVEGVVRVEERCQARRDRRRAPFLATGSQEES